MRLRFQPTRSMVARWLIGVGIILVASTAFGQEPLAEPIAKARETVTKSDTPANRFAVADLCFRRAEFQLGLAGRARDDARRAALTDDARAHLNEAARVLGPALDALKQQRAGFIEQALDAAEPGEAPEDPPAEMERGLQQAWLLDGRIRLALGELALHAAGADEDATRAAKRQVLAAITSCSDLEWEYDGWYVAYWSHITQARCYAALGRTGDAFTALAAIVALPKEDATAAVRTEAYRRTAELQLRHGRYAEAVETFATASQDYPDLLGNRTGQTLHLLAGNAHAKAGNHDKAVSEALKVIEAERRIRYRAAMDHLADWAGGWNDAPARIRFLQGDALYHQARTARVPDRYLAAIEAYKAAAGRAGRTGESKQYAVSAWRAIGACYEALERYREAALAYERGAKREDVDRPLAAECARRAYAAWRQAVEADPTAVNRDAMRQARARLITKFPDAEGSGDLGYFAARDLEKEGKYLQAAQAYDAVADGSAKKSQAVARAGGCYYREYARRAAQAQEQGVRLSPSDTALLSEAETRCSRFLQIPGGTAAARALAVYYLGRIAGERADHAQVVKLFTTFDEAYGESQPKLTSDVLYLGIRSAVQVPDVAAAEDMLARLLRHDAKSSHCSAAVLEVAKAVDAAGDRPKRAAELYLQWLSHTADADPAAQLAVAVRARKVAEILPQGEDAAWWEHAAKLLRPLYVTRSELEDAQQEIVLHSLWKCEQALGNWTAVEPLIAVLQAANPNNIPLLRARIRCLRELIRAARNDRKELRRRLTTVRELCTQLLRTRRQFTPEWWEAKEWQLETLYELGEYGLVFELVQNLRLLVPQMGGPERKARLLALQQQAEAKRKK